MSIQDDLVAQLQGQLPMLALGAGGGGGQLVPFGGMGGAGGAAPPPPTTPGGGFGGFGGGIMGGPVQGPEAAAASPGAWTKLGGRMPWLNTLAPMGARTFAPAAIGFAGKGMAKSLVDQLVAGKDSTNPGPWGSMAGGATAGAGVGATAGLMGGPLAPLSVPVGTAIGALIGGGLGFAGYAKPKNNWGTAEALLSQYGASPQISAQIKKTYNTIRDADGGQAADAWLQPVVGTFQSQWQNNLTNQNSGMPDALAMQAMSGSFMKPYVDAFNANLDAGAKQMAAAGVDPAISSPITTTGHLVANSYGLQAQATPLLQEFANQYQRVNSGGSAGGLNALLQQSQATPGR